MASPTGIKTETGEKQGLADFIKSVHGNLRKQVQKAKGDFRSVWEKHCRDSSLLQQYSQCMKELAVEHWGGNNLKRIEWCKDICVEYFYEGGKEKCLSKDCRRVLLNLDQHQNCNCQREAEILQLRLNSEDYEMKSDKLVLLDVGSCFNPFQAYSDIFIPLAIDLCPADKSVFTCDFLFLEVVPKDSDISSKAANKSSHRFVPTNTMPNHCDFPEQLKHYLDNGTAITTLPENTFDVVVFCLLLSYLPAREQRWTCCFKAHQLLKENGLLIIITPDSSHQNKNMEMIKSWRTAIERIGFLRWKYHKDNHTHCMAFRKKIACTGRDDEKNEGDRICLEKMMYIHQDLVDENLEVTDDDSTAEYDEITSSSLKEGFGELPFA